MSKPNEFSPLVKLDSLTGMKGILKIRQSSNNSEKSEEGELVLGLEPPTKVFILIILHSVYTRQLS